jgi:large repetitive protein
MKVDESNLFSCPDTVMVRLQHLFPEITYSIDKTNVSECNGIDGTITLNNVAGGNGAKQSRLMLVSSPDPLVVRDFDDVSVAFPSVGSGSYYIEIQDESGCLVSSIDSPTVISSPGAVDFTVTKIADADCINNGKSAVISIAFTIPGNYLIGIGKSQVLEPSNYVSYTYNDGDPAIFVDTLSRGSYFVFVKPASGTVCPSTRPTGEIEGAYAVSFEVQRVCFATIQPTVNLINVVGQPNAQMTVEVYRLSNMSEKVDEFTVTTADVIPITYEGEPSGNPHSWLIQPDTYVIKAYQNQSFCPGEPTTPSYQVTYTSTQPMTLAIENIKQSLPDPRHSGAFTLKTIVGGSPLSDVDSGPYFIVSVLDPSSNAPIVDEMNVYRNSQGNYQHDFRNLPVGNYLVKVVDNNGCEATTIVIVPADTRILIPNIFTPNNDSVNDQFEVVNLPEGGKHKLVITNRWGKEIFSTGEYREGKFWDAEGEPDGIYFYRLQVDGEDTYTGWVEVLRGDKP